MARGQQLRILIGVVAAGVLGSALVGAAYYWEKVIKPQRNVVQRLIERERSGDKPDPGQKEFAAALDFIRTGDFFAARERLAYLMRYYSDSAKYPEAKRVLGEINVDLLISKSPAPWKTNYTVRPGDSLSRIASIHRCTLDYIVRANGLTTINLTPGDKLWVAPLEFSLKANMKERTLTLFRQLTAETRGDARSTEEEFFKEYRIVEFDLPPTVRIPYETKISDKPAWEGSKPVPFSATKPAYFSAHRWLQTNKPGLVIQPVPADPVSVPAERKAGILLAEGDLKELYTIVRTGTPLRLAD
jgi:hypothetical protein